MSTIDWPEQFERTPPSRRTRNRKFQAALGSTTKSLAGELDRMDVDDYRASTGSGGSYTKSNGMPKHNANPDDPGFVLRWSKDGEQFAVACDAYQRLKNNARAVYLWLHETRMRSKRPVVTGESEFAAARLPSGDESDATVLGQQPAHEVLGVQPDAPAGVVKAAYRELVKDAHPDQGGSNAEFQRLKAARDRMLD